MSHQQSRKENMIIPTKAEIEAKELLRIAETDKRNLITRPKLPLLAPTQRKVKSLAPTHQKRKNLAPIIVTFANKNSNYLPNKEKLTAANALNAV